MNNFKNQNAKQKENQSEQQEQAAATGYDEMCKWSWLRLVHIEWIIEKAEMSLWFWD